MTATGSARELTAIRSVDDHLADCLSGLGPLPARELPLLQAAGCVLAQDVVSAIDLPGFDNSAMDGYAVRAGDLVGATDAAPRALPVAGDIPAGSAENLRLEPGSSLRIMTGAAVPAGADAIVPVEWTDAGTGAVQIRRAPLAGAFVRHRGDDVSAGERVLLAGTRLAARQIALLAAVGLDRVLVHPRPLVIVMPTGDELVEPGKPLAAGQIHDSNGYGLVAAVRELGADAEHGGVIADDAESVSRLLAAAAERADLLITTGGVSAGAYDTVKAVLRELGTVGFGKVAMQPGMPQGFGTIGPRGTPIFTLPGNPVSALVSFEVFVRPALLILAGHRAEPRPGSAPGIEAPSVLASAAVGWASPAGRRQFVRARLERGSGSDLLVRPVGGQGSHLVADLAEADCLAVVAEGVTAVAAGDRLRCLLLERRAGFEPAAAQPQLQQPQLQPPPLQQPPPRFEGAGPALTHLDERGAARMVDVSAKQVSVREASATGRVLCSRAVTDLLRSAGMPKGDALAVARIAGIQAAKRTPELVPLAHPVAVHAVQVELQVADDGVDISATVRTADRTGVEMEALTCVTVAGLALIDMIKAVDRQAEITQVRLNAKSGGRSGDWRRA